MDRDRIILLRILSLVLLLPLILFIYFNITNIKEQKELLSRFDKNSSDIAGLQTEIQNLTLERERLQAGYKDLSTSLFNEDEITFYEFCDFIVNAAKNRGVKIENYSTNESAVPKRINISAAGNITAILDFLNYLYIFDKKIDIDQITVSYNPDKNDYKLTILINFISINSLKRNAQ